MFSFTCRVRHTRHPADHRALRAVIRMLVLETGTPEHQWSVEFGAAGFDHKSYYQDLMIQGLESEPSPDRQTVWA